ncbi:mannitol dehydrogenase family protein [Roseinatronobacter monicus]|uniref:Mannitol 2-dehydrogenase n=1 Tax=Roseinatronobacter monicus TaxID=393481 RepID=A0A543K3L5_9RHOB|nr:mannitol dehydrogenase family protein [Roseinatronobacter monicus]TQM89662.1 mannitol 2-dehydrogenase [Roseinatronobacter monicus]
MQTITLNNSTLTTIPSGIARPRYDRSALAAGILHIGVGNFHRAHQAWYLHRLMQQGLSHEWAIIGAGVRPFDEQQRQKMRAQDYLTTLIELDPSGRSAEIVGSMIDYVPVQEGNVPLIERMAQPDIRIVSLTVTESGYYVDPATNAFNAAHPDIVHDVQNPDTPQTAFGAIMAALRLRRDRGHGPFTGLSCDNLQGNGAILRQTVVSLARLSDPELADWIDQTCTFPNSMVDCIVPATGPKELALVRELGVADDVPVSHENFRQWVIEDKFCSGRPAWDKVGVTFSDRVHDYETMKLRILNAGHQIIAGAGELLSIDTISGCMAHPGIASLFSKVETEEIAPFVVPVPGMTPESYINLIGERFRNPAIVDTTRRVAYDGASRHAGFLLPIMREALATDGSIDGLALVEAIWARMCHGTREDGSLIEPNDPNWMELTRISAAAKEKPQVWLDQRHIYGDLGKNARLAVAFEKWLKLIWDTGIDATLKVYCGKD